MEDRFMKNGYMGNIEIPETEIDPSYYLEQQKELMQQAYKKELRRQARQYIVDEIDKENIVPANFWADKSDLGGLQIRYKDYNGNEHCFDDGDVMRDFMNEVAEIILANGFERAWARIYISKKYLGYQMCKLASNAEVNDAIEEVAIMLENGVFKGQSK